MRKLILILSLLLFALLPAKAIIRIDANPINVAFGLSQETDSAKIVSTLSYYGYVMEGRFSDLLTYKHPNGSVIKFSYKDATPAQPYPYVEVKSNQAGTNTNKALEGLQFKKTGSHYVRNVGHHAKTETRCSHSHQGYLVFQRTVLPRK